MKSYYFPDRSWERETSLAYGFIIWLGLSLYWIAPYIITSGIVLGRIYMVKSFWLISFVISLYIVGVFLHFCSDMYKDTFIKYNKKKLINSGLFKRSRNMNYFGEFLIYISFAILSGNLIPFIVLTLFITVIWIPNMLRKDRSLEKYQNFKEYKKKSSLFIPM